MKLKVLLGLTAVAAPVIALSPLVSTTAANAKVCTYPPGKSTLTISTSKNHVTPGEKVIVYGTLKEKGCVVAKGRIHLLKNGHGRKQHKTNSEGDYHFSIKPTETQTYSTLFKGNHSADGASSSKVTVVVTYKRKHHHH